MGQWVPAGESTLCTRHNATFPRGHVCVQCGTDPGPPIEEDPAPLIAGPDVTCGDHEEFFIRVAEKLETRARNILDGRGKVKTSGDRSIVASKLLDTAIKARRA